MAESFGARVRHFAWCDDFSAARNFSIQGVAEDWILCLDADDYFPPGEASKLREVVQQDGFTAWTLNYRVLQGHTPAPGLKLFRNHFGVSYEGIIHEYIRHSLARIPNARIGHADILLEHTGYSPELVIAKRSRNIPLLRREMERAHQAGDFRQMLYVAKNLGSQLMENGAIEEGQSIMINALDGALRRGDRFSSDWEISILANLISHFQNTGGEQKAVEVCSRFEILFAGHPLFKLYRGLAHFRVSKFNEARADFLGFQEAVKVSPPKLAIPEGYLGVDLWELLGHCYFSLGDFAGAVGEFSKCQEVAPRMEFQVKLNLAKRLLENEKSAGA
jgi:glycosyltransferase involved in cell wall biosynthesis